MKNKYKIDLNPPKISDEQIAQHMDFDAVLAQAQVSPDSSGKTSRPTRWLYYLGGAVAASLLGFFIYQSTAVNSVEVDKAYFAAKPFIDPPFKAIKANYTQKKLNANRGGIFEYSNGSRIIVPAAAFIDDQGIIVEGEVDIRYREFHDFVDFFLSGIPMQYDSAGMTYQLESAGMIEIYAEKNGKKVNVAPGKKIDVELVSEIMVPANDRAKMPKFNVYQLDTEKRNWVYTSPDNIEFLPEEKKAASPKEETISLEYQENLADLRQQEQSELNTIEASLPKAIAPVRPERANGNDFSFDFEFNDINSAVQSGNSSLDDAQNAANQTEQEIQNLRRQYEGTLWQVSPNNTKFDQKVVANINWEDMKLNRINNRDYELTLISGSNQMKVLVNPVLMGADYEKAIQEFNQEFEAYEQKMAEREALLAEQKTVLKEKYEELRKEAEKKYEDRLAELRQRGQDHLATDEMIKRKIINRFQATTFGIWNCDRPFPPFLVRVNGEFKDDANNDFEENTAFLVNQSRNTVCRFRAHKGAKVNFNSDSKNMMWLITKDNKLALFRPEKFNKINSKEKDFTFVMNVVDKAIETEEDVRKILEF